MLRSTRGDARSTVRTPGGDLVEQRSRGGREDQIDRKPALGDALAEVEDDALGPTAMQPREEEGDRLPGGRAHAQSSSRPSHR